MITFSKLPIFWLCFVALMVLSSRADQVVMQNGDILNGKVMEMSTNTLVLQDDNLGLVTLSREKVAKINFGTAAATVPSGVVAATNGMVVTGHSVSNAKPTSGLAAELQGIRSQTNLIQQVQAEILGSSASPEAVNKFNELLDGISTGKIDMNELRAQAKSAADQLQSFTNEMGPEASLEAAGYLSILNSFLQETAPTNSATP